MIITKEMWTKNRDNHQKQLDRLQKRNDAEDKFHIEQHIKTINEINLIIDKKG